MFPTTIAEFSALLSKVFENKVLANYTLKVLAEPYSDFAGLADAEECQAAELSEAQARQCWTGSLPMLLFYMADFGKFGMKFYRTKYWHPEQPLKRKWDKALALIENGTADMLLSVYEPSEQRKAVLNFFDPPYFASFERAKNVRYAIIRQDSGSDRLFDSSTIFSVFPVTIWFAIALSLFSVSLVMAGFSRKSGMSFIKELMYTMEMRYRMLVGIDSVKETSAWNRINSVSFFWSILSLCISSIFASLIISHTTIVKAWQAPFSSLEGMERTGYT